jgi:3-dehydroshikimate dehydratase
MVVLSGFGDEISADLDEQMDVMESEGIRHIELRSVWQTGVLGLSDEQLERIKGRLDDRGFRISAIGSGLGKFGILDDFDKQICDCKTAIRMAEFFGCRFIRVFSYYPPEGGSILDHREAVIERLKALAELAAASDIVLGHENERGIYGEQPAQCRDIIHSVGSPNLQTIFDPANFVQSGAKPLEDCWPMLKDDVCYFHVKDAKMADGSVTPAGEGDGGVPEILADKLSTGWEGFLSLEPHLKVAGPAGGFSGPLAFKAAAVALKRILDKIGADYE